MKTYEYHSFIQHTLIGKGPCAWFIARHQGAGSTHFLHPSETFQNQLFSDEQIIFPNFHSFLDTSTFPGRTWFTEGSTLPQSLEKASIFARYRNRLQWVCYNNPLFHLSFLFSSRNIKWFFPSRRPAQPSPTPSQDFWPDHALVSRNALAP